MNPGARWATAIGGFVALFLGSVSGFIVFLGFIALLVAAVWPWTQRVTVGTTGSPTQPSTTTPTTAHTPAAPHRPTQFEQDLAKHWFSWLGIISLVVGVTLLLNFAFSGWGQLGRVMTGYCSALMLFGLWYWLKRMYRGFAFILQGGAWAIVYISTYFLHSVDQSSISAPTTVGALLLGVVAVIIAAALLQRSKALTIGAFFLGYVTAFTNEINLFTLVALLLLSIGVVAVATYQAWPELILAGTIATYLVQASWMLNQYNLSDVAATAAGFLILEVLVFGAAHWLLSPTTQRHRTITIAGTVLNLLGFYALFNYVVKMIDNPHGWIATLFIGVVCALLAGATNLATTRRFLRPIYTVFAIGFITLALGQWLQGDTLAWAYLIESTAVVCLGAIMGERTIRYSAYVVSFISLLSVISVLLGPASSFGTTTIHARLVIGLLAAILYTLSAAVLRYRRNILPSNERYVGVIFADVAVVVAMIVAGQELPFAWVPVVWSVGALGLLGLGLQMKSLNARGVAYALSVFTAFYWVANVMGTHDLAGGLNVHARLLSGIWVVLIYILSAFVLRLKSAALSKDERLVTTGYIWAAVVLLTVILGTEVSSSLISVAWGVEGVILYIIGFAAQSLQARRQGLLVLGLTILKVYIIDIQTLEPGYRILSFIILGFILLGIGFLYNRWRQQKAQLPPQ